VRLDLIDRLSSLVPRRCIAIDLGRSHIKILLAEKSHRGLQILRHHMISVQEEGLISAEEINHHLQVSIAEYGNYPVVLVIPQHQAISQVVEVPASDHPHLQEFIEEETLRLSGLGESAVIYDYLRLRPFGKFHSPVWITIARESEIQPLVQKLIAGGVTVCGITTSANALLSAYQTTTLPSDHIVLADLGATSTTVAILVGSQGVCVSSIPIGSESFTEAVANIRRCSFEEAESIKHSQNLFQGDSRLPAFVEVVDVWLQDFEKLLREWMEDNTDLEGKLQPLRIMITGGGASQLGFIPYLHAKSVFEFQSWPEAGKNLFKVPLDRYAIACGAVVEAFNPIGRHCSLLPTDLRRQRKRHDQTLLVNAVSLVLLVLLTLVLAGGVIQKIVLARAKAELLSNAEAALKKARGIDVLNQQRDLEYAKVLPVLRRQKSTTDFFRVFEVIQQLRAPRDLWFVLLADQASYFAGSPLATYGLGPSNFTEVAAQSTNTPHATNGFILELCIPDKGEEKLKPLNDLVAEMKKSNLFRKVDSLPANQRTNLVDPKRLLPERHFALAIELAEHALFEPALPMAEKTNKTSTPAPP
jgi:Tfp pilus assembly PilM family ATPase